MADMSDKLLILGAGVDRTEGLNFPLATNLLAEISRYLAREGKPVDQALRKMLPGLKFSFNSMIARAVDKIATRETHEQKAMVQRVRDAIANLPEQEENIRKHGELIIRFFEKLATIAEESYLDLETEELIRAVFPKDAEELIDSESILDIHKLSLSDTFKTVLKKTLKIGLTGEKNVVANALGADMLNIETLLVEKFLGFYNEKPSDIKNYLYISWALWAFLVEKQKAVISEHRNKELPFYSQIPSDLRALTLNYTAFLQEHLGSQNVIHFHGGLAEYVRMDTRNLLPIEDVLSCDPADFIQRIVMPNVKVTDEDLSKQKHVIPALVPPLRLKPILSHKYIDLWSAASNWIETAEHIVVIGYSFNNADEHFNDILRSNSNRKIDVAVPEADSASFLKRMEKVFNVPTNQFDTVEVQGRSALKARNLRLIPAKATEINVKKLFNEK